jgi:hypothetical protein
MNPYLTVPFKFTDSAWIWLQEFLDPIAIDFQLNAPNMSALVQIKEDALTILRQSAAWSEIVQFLKNYGDFELLPQLFIYKTLPRARVIILGNPHIDTSGKDGTEYTIPFRFNILTKGDENTEMVWWPHDRDSSVVTHATFVRPDRTTVGRLQAKGANLTEQWNNVGAPFARCAVLAKKQEYASFVRTDILHALNWTGSESRIILSVRCTNMSWDSFIEKFN